MIAAAGHFGLASWVLAGAFVAFAVTLVVAVVVGEVEQRRRRPSVGEALDVLVVEGLISWAQRRALLRAHLRGLAEREQSADAGGLA